jgi:hypothetical protein
MLPETSLENNERANLAPRAGQEIVHCNANGRFPAEAGAGSPLVNICGHAENWRGKLVSLSSGWEPL